MNERAFAVELMRVQGFDSISDDLLGNLPAYLGMPSDRAPVHHYISRNFKIEALTVIKLA